MLELTTEERLRAATDDDSVLLWAAQGLTGGARAWARGRAVAVTTPALSGRDRIAVRGPLADLLPLLDDLLALVGPSYRPFGDAGLLAELCAHRGGLEPLGSFGWMQRTAASLPLLDGDGGDGGDGGGGGGGDGGGDRRPTARWLAPGELDEAAELIDRYFPASHAHPHRPGVRAWAGVRDEEGRLTALAADAWPAPSVGLLAGVVSDPVHGRGRGHAAAACRLVLAGILGRSTHAALMVDAWNEPAIGLYRRLGLEHRQLGAAAQRGAAEDH
ncbi:GNAT family N-acetyltransferase [Kitasatospora sp. NA04385]|uniref:GNAT family N-acetyltransferase n=1 Tax=Kitasatospora sp. NA04385 TaxID=2742135 RepID=UPI001590D40E|nr:GNAT family N-acetyltransferase [Kitasatospora sp. NA04385]QKW23522.1 GNAT family N-acetyltransferase [Kitasatospora sp. NA04385]